jgi:hypothetical protein
MQGFRLDIHETELSEGASQAGVKMALDIKEFFVSKICIRYFFLSARSPKHKWENAINTDLK